MIDVSLLSVLVMTWDGVISIRFVGVTTLYLFKDTLDLDEVGLLSIRMVAVGMRGVLARL